MNGVFNEQILAEKLAKLNNTQQCIETLSHWCIFHRSKAELVVATWDKQFRIAEMVEKVPLLYLANDILQNSKRKGNEFVSEFWKVLPTALKEVVEKGDDRGKTVVSRLVDIWEERRVFGSRAQSLKDLMLGKESPAPLEFKRKRGRSVKIFKRDSRSVRTKLTIGGTPEKIVTAFHLVISDHSNEDEEMTKCKSSIHRLRKMEEEVDSALNRKKDPKRKTLAKQVEEEEVILKQAVEKLKVVEANRVALVSQLREALHEQESELENVRTQMQVAQAQAEEACTTRRHLEDEDFVPVPTPSIAPASSTNPAPKGGESTKKTTAAIAAEVADMLTSSTSSQYIMSSVLSTFAAEAAKSAGLTKSSAAGTSSSMPNNVVSTSQLSSEQMVVDPNVLIAANKHISQNNVYQMPSASMNGHMLNSQTSYHSLPNPTSQHYLQASGALVTSYGYANLPRMPSAPPPPTPPSYMVSPMVPLTQQSLQMTQQQPLTIGNQLSMLNQQQMGSVPPQLSMPSFRTVSPMPPPGMVYYTHPHQSQ